MFRVEAAVRPVSKSIMQQFRKLMATIQKKILTHTKIKDLNFDKEDFAQCGKKKRPLVPSPKKKFNPLDNSDKKTLSVINLDQLLKYTFYCCCKT